MGISDSGTGDNCGASYLNENYKKHLLCRLRDEHHLEKTGESRESIVNYLIPAFENTDKRKKDVTKRPAGRLRIPGLVGDARTGISKGFDDNHMLLDSYVVQFYFHRIPKPCSRPNINANVLPSGDYESIFVPLLKRVGAVMRSQLEAANADGFEVKVCDNF
jgi:hypothetical protein